MSRRQKGNKKKKNGKRDILAIGANINKYISMSYASDNALNKLCAKVKRQQDKLTGLDIENFYKNIYQRAYNYMFKNKTRKNKLERHKSYKSFFEFLDETERELNKIVIHISPSTYRYPGTIYDAKFKHSLTIIRFISQKSDPFGLFHFESDDSFSQLSYVERNVYHIATVYRVVVEELAPLYENSNNENDENDEMMFKNPFASSVGYISKDMIAVIKRKYELYRSVKEDQYFHRHINLVVDVSQIDLSYNRESVLDEQTSNLLNQPVAVENSQNDSVIDSLKESQTWFQYIRSTTSMLYRVPYTYAKNKLYSVYMYIQNNFNWIVFMLFQKVVCTLVMLILAYLGLGTFSFSEIFSQFFYEVLWLQLRQFVKNIVGPISDKANIRLIIDAISSRFSGTALEVFLSTIKNAWDESEWGSFTKFRSLMSTYFSSNRSLSSYFAELEKFMWSIVNGQLTFKGISLIVEIFYAIVCVGSDGEESKNFVCRSIRRIFDLMNYARIAEMILSTTADIVFYFRLYNSGGKLKQSTWNSPCSNRYMSLILSDEKNSSQRRSAHDTTGPGNEEERNAGKSSPMFILEDVRITPERESEVYALVQRAKETVGEEKYLDVVLTQENLAELGASNILMNLFRDYERNTIGQVVQKDYVDGKVVDRPQTVVRVNERAIPNHVLQLYVDQIYSKFSKDDKKLLNIGYVKEYVRGVLNKVQEGKLKNFDGDMGKFMESDLKTRNAKRRVLFSESYWEYFFGRS